MQPKSVSSFPVDSSDWAFWLDSIALKSDPHATLAEVEDQVQFLSEQEKQGLSFQKLTIDKILNTTEKFWKDPSVKQTEKAQMLKGIRYIHQQRQARYERLFWLVRIFAKLRGVEAGLRAERQAIDRLEADLNHTPLSSDSPKPKTAKPNFYGAKLPTITKPVVVFDKKINDQLEGIKKEVDALIKRRDRLKGDEKKEWYEQFFTLEQRLYTITQKLPSALLLKIKDRTDELHKIFAAENKNTPRVKDIVDLFGFSSLKSSLSETLSTLCANQSVTDSELNRDQSLFQCSKLEAEALYIRRLIKAQRTDLSLSLVTAIERTWKEIGESDKEGETRIFDLDRERWRVIFLPKEKEIYLKEDYISAGSYKAVFAITPFHNLETKEDRSQIVILQSLQGVFTEIEEHEAKRAEENEESQSLDSKAKLSHSEPKKGEAGEISAIKISKSIDADKSVSKKSSGDAEDSSLSKTQPYEFQSMIIVESEVLKKEEGVESSLALSTNSQTREDPSLIIHADPQKSERVKQDVQNGEQPIGSVSAKQVVDKTIEIEKVEVVTPSDLKGSSHKLARMASEIGRVVIEKSVKKSEGSKKLRVSKSSKDDSLEEDDESYKKEAQNCLLYGKLPGIWPTFKATTVDKRIAILQPTASYFLKTTAGDALRAINLEDMCILLDNKLLAKKDQLAFIKMVRHALTGIESLHKEDLIHRDLKPQNILCANDGTAGVSDLGTLCPSTVESFSGSGKRKPNVEKMEVAGTPNYISPDMALYGNSINWAKINTAVDIWSLGLILWEAFSGQPLDKHPVHLSLGRLTRVTPIGIVRLISEILSNKKMRGDIYKKLYPEPKEESSLAHLIWSCTRPDPSLRPPIAEIIVRYEAWAKYTEDKMKAGEIQSIRDTFQDAVV